MFERISSFLGREVDNSALVVFRVIFGFLVACETIGAIFTGWVDRTLIQPTFTFNFIGFEWLQPLPGDGMIYYFIVMGVAGLMIMLGLFYRFSTVLLFVMWTCVYLMQKSEYNNHYYLLVLLTGVMSVMPAHRDRSLDVQFGIAKQSDTCLNVFPWFFILQILIVYVSASLNKVHPDWLMAKPIGIWFQYKSSYWLIGPLLANEWFQYVIAWGGVVYDGLIFFLLLYKPTRKLGFVLSIIFNLFNSAVFQIGIFPYLMIGLTVFFFPAASVRKFFFRESKRITTVPGKLSRAFTFFVVGYFLIQVLLPIRHHFFKGDVHWTEEGHRLAWQMMLRTKSGRLTIEVEDKSTGDRSQVVLRDYLSGSQRRSMIGEPDMVWQFAQRLKKEYQANGVDIAVYAKSQVSLNGHTRQPLIDPSVDLAAVPWDRWRHSDWILTYDSYD